MDDRGGLERKGQELDREALARWLGERLGLTGKLGVSQFPAGFSNWTYLVEVGDQELVLRRAPTGTKAATAHDMLREHRMLEAIHPAFPLAPRPLAACEDAAVLGTPFFAMARIPGLVLRAELPAGMKLAPEAAGGLGRRMGELHAELHRIDPAKVGLAGLDKGPGYARRQVEGWCKRYRAAMTPDAPPMEGVRGWLTARCPEDSPRRVVVHNDYKLDNIVLAADDPTRIAGVLDWEMATVGDPWMDLGSSLAYWVEAKDPPEWKPFRLMPTDLPGMPGRGELWERHGAMLGTTPPRIGFYRVFGLFRLAAIAQQLYYRHHHGQVKDSRFAGLIHAVRALEIAARATIDQG